MVDVQEAFVPHLYDVETFLSRCGQLLEAATILSIPCIATEQAPEKLGATVPNLRAKIASPISKTRFSAAPSVLRIDRIAERTIDQIVICGIETHICVLQTALDLREAGLGVFVVSDGCRSRSKRNHDAGIHRMTQHGVEIVTVEMALFEWLGDATHEKFRDVSRLIR